ncbi:MAG: biopolymer transporter ExbD [Planctomycetaceae bacterium]|nr:biopolymer transporter ExbD [Planctomycetaceae bacterium]
MKLPSRQRSGGLKFNLTPMIDVVFNLIIFFLAASHLARSDVAADVELPEAQTGGPESPESSHRLIVTVLADGTLSIGRKDLALPQVEQMILGGAAEHSGDFEVRIRTDRRVPYGQIEPLLLACARAGVVKVRFAVLPSQ